MPHLNDNELDRLSREASDQFDVEPATSGWDALERRLDEALPQERRKRRLLIWWWLTGVLLLGGALWGILNWKEEGQVMVTKQEQKNESITDNNKRNKEAIENVPHSAVATNPAEGASEQLVASEKPVTSENLVARGDGIKVTRREASDWAQRAHRAQREHLTQHEPLAQRERNSTSNNSSTSNNKEKNSQRASTAEVPLSVVIPPSPTKTEAPPYVKEKQDQQHAETENSVFPAQKSSSQNSPAVPGNQPSPQTSVSDSMAETVSKPTQTTTKKRPLNPSSRRHSFYATLLAGADFSNVKFSSAGRTGFNGGLQVGFYFTNRLSINTGIVYNKKNYNARGKDFTAKGPMVYYNIDKIEGSCTMLDIPLNIRYDLGIKPRSRYFISTGVSSYLMDTEDYDYYFYNNNGDYSNRNLKSGKNISHLFSILNFSGGVEKQLGGKLHFIAEPYLKIPVTGLGTGNILLNSFGINLGLKYQFSANKKP